MLSIIKSAAKQLPFIRRLIAQREQLQEALAQKTAELAQLAAQRAQRDGAELESGLAALRRACGFVPPGHFYSPLPAFDEILKEESRIFGPVPREIPGVDLREAEQLQLLEQFAKFYPDIPFRIDPTPRLRYHYENPSYAYSDGVMLHCMLRHLKPKRLIEIGSGYSSCVTLDTNDLFLGGTLETTFIEPYPELLKSLISDADRRRLKIVPKRLQDVELELFSTLRSGDVLFVDSTHVSKIDSDVNRLFFDILPALAPGVVIHFHDIFYPFEYPKESIQCGRAWNEMYELRAFLQYNRSFRILLMNTFMAHFHRQFLQEKMPLCLTNIGGSIWLEKCAANS